MSLSLTVEDQERQEQILVDAIGNFFDAGWYRTRYPDTASSHLEPIRHYIRFGLVEQRDPNRFFDCAWYGEQYPDVAAGGMHPLLHYLTRGAVELRNPHPRFDARYYVETHPDAAANPLLYHIRVGNHLGYLTERPIDIQDYLPSERPMPQTPTDVVADVVIPVYRGLEETQTCLRSVLAAPCATLGRIIVVEDRSPEPALVRWLRELEAEGRIVLIRNQRNQGFVRSANLGIQATGDHDVVLLNSDTEVPAGWLDRLAAQAYAEPKIASVSPFSNNATICGYPDNVGGPMAFGASLRTLDEICQSVNRGRYVDVPTTVGFCMYIRRAALDDVGVLDAELFNQGYGEENDFCLRALASGWRHRHACDTFVYHRGSVSFGKQVTKLTQRAMRLLEQRFPGYAHLIARHVAAEEITPFRFAITANLLCNSGLPVILAVSHNLGGGVRRDIERLIERFAGKAHFLLLQATDRGASLSVPTLRRHPELPLPAERIGDLIRVLRSMNVSRVHIHHVVGMDMDIRELVHRLGVPFDLTVHDYYTICPQMTLLPFPAGMYCGEPDVSACNTCISARASHGARDIVTWRAEHAWLLLDADRVFCPSNDVLTRLRRYGLAEKAVLAQHEAVEAEAWPLRRVPPIAGKFRIAVLGAVAEHKGAPSVAALTAIMDRSTTEIHVIGYTEDGFPPHALKRLKVTGQYAEHELAELIERIDPHVIWFPAIWPETFSFTLSSAIASGRPIAATRIGAFVERLEGRPNTWTVPPDTSPGDWAALFRKIAATLEGAPLPPVVPVRRAIADFYASNYLAPPPKVAIVPRERAVAVVPERYNTGTPTPCGYIRLVQPLSHPATSAGGRLLLADSRSVLDYRPDVIVTQRHAVPSVEAAETLIDHARRSGIALVYDLDDDLLTVPPRHANAAELRPLAGVVRLMLERADFVWVSTQILKDRVAGVRPDALVMENRLDERLWTGHTPRHDFIDAPVRILCMGTSTHDRDYAMIEPALARLSATYHERVMIDILGMTTSREIPERLRRLGPPAQASRSYPGFAAWMSQYQPCWHIGLAPLADTAFNRSKSAIKTMDYTALGLAILASDVAPYRGSLADGTAGCLLPNDPDIWFAALDWLVRDQNQRRAFAAAGQSVFAAQATLAGQTEARQEIWARLFPSSRLRNRGSGIDSGHEASEQPARKRRRNSRGT